MDGKRISQLTPDTSPSTDDYIVTVDGSTTQNKRVELGSLPVSNPTVAQLNGKVNKAGDTMTGNLIIPAPTQPTHATTKSYVDNVTPIYGTGFPNGVVSATPGRIYIDENITNGASSWVKKSGTGNTGWQVLEGDTGWRRLDIALTSSGYIYYRRIGQDVSVALGGGTFDSIMYATDAPINTRRRIVAAGGVPVGFRFSRAQTALLTSNSEFIVGAVYHSGAGDSNFIELRNSGRAIVTSEYIRPASVTFQTNESWPVLLPGVSS